MDDLYLHKLAKSNIDAKKEIDKILMSLGLTLEEGQEMISILSAEIAFERVKKILEN